MHLNIALVLGLGALTNALPTNNDNVPQVGFTIDGVPNSELQSMYNITDAQLAALNVSSVGELFTGDDRVDAFRHEIGSDEICHTYYQFIMNRWIIQFPESWYRPKHRNRTEACVSWFWGLHRYMPNAGVIMQECHVRDDADMVGWLHMRFTTIIGVARTQVEGTIHRLADPKGVAKDPKPITC
jgi:hypothetical protein